MSAFLFFLFFLFSAVFTLQGQSTVSLSSITMAAEPDYPPYSFLDERGRAAGFSVELFKAAAEIMELEVSIETGLWSDIKLQLEEGKIDALPLVGRTPEREEVFDFTIPYLSLYGGIAVRKGEKDIETFKELTGKRVAVMKGDNAEEFLRRSGEDFIILTTPTFKEALELLEAGECDAVVIQRLVGLRILRDEGFTGLEMLHEPIWEFRQDFCFAVTEGNKELLALLNEGLALVIADGTFRRLQTEWFAATDLPSGKIIVGGDHNFPPFEFLDLEGKPAGYTVDLSRAIAREMGLDIEIRLGPWAQMVRMLEHGEIDILQGMIYSPERDRLFDFSQPHSVYHNVAVGRKDEGTPVPANMEEFRGKRLAVEEGDLMHEVALQYGLEEELTLAETQEEALQMTALGETDYTFAGRLAALYMIEKNGWDNLVIGRNVLFSSDYGYAVREGNRTLLSYFSEGLAVIEDTGDYRRIYDKWLGVYAPAPPRLRDMIRIVSMVLIPLLLLLAGSFLWNRTLKHQVALRTSELHDSEKQYRLLSENTADVIWLMSPDMVFRYINPSIELLTGYTQKEWTGTRIEEHCDEKSFKVLSGAIAMAAESITGNTGFNAEAEWYRKNGDSITVGISGTVLFDKAGTVEGIQGVSRDIRERKHYERTLEENFLRKQWLNSIATLYLSRNRPESLIRITVEELSRHFADLRISFSTIDADGILRVRHSVQPAGMPDIASLEADLNAAPGYLHSLRNSKRTVISDVQINSMTQPLLGTLQSTGTSSLAVVPVLMEGRDRGLLSFNFPKPREWKEHELLTLEEHANLLALILENEKYQRMMAKANETLALSLEEKNTLLKEVHHRVKNNLNVIVSLLRLQEDQIDSVESAKEAFEQSRNRIFSMALVHESLCRSDNLAEIKLDAYIRELLGELKGTMPAGKRIDYSFELETINMDISTAVPCGIIINELVTNAWKHAFEDGREGTITISLERGQNSLISLSVRDNGSGLPPGFSLEKASSLGLQLVSILTNQIEGELLIDSDGGTAITVRFPETTPPGPGSLPLAIEQ